MKPLQPLNIDLHGTSLIEASAGTGKTYTITTLFLRILLEQQVSIDRILVVTFTIAATEELRIKITERVLLALTWLNCSTDAERERVKADDLLLELLQKQDSTTAIKLLEDAASRLDEASVYTIDAFCMRVLQDNAFETGMPYRTDFVADDLDIKTRAVQDFWRHTIGTKNEHYLSALTAKYKSPDQLSQAIEKLLQFADAEYLVDISSAETDELETELNELHSDMLSVWAEQSGEIRSLLISNDVLNKRSYKTDKTTGVLGQFDEFLQQPVKPQPLFDGFALLTSAKITASTRKHQTVPSHRLFDLCEQFAVAHSRWVKLLSMLVQMDAVDYIRKSVRRHKEDGSILHFEDLRVRLYESINSASGKTLASHVRQRWPYALIDEFQDTDPQQYHVFNQVYGAQPENGLFLIGDPKQAIYSFRGADIFAYIKASLDTKPEQRYTLDTNWRSTSQYVDAINAIFSTPEAPFIFNDEIPFNPVKAAGVADKAPLSIDGQQATPLQFWLLQPPADNNQTKTPKFTAGFASTQAIDACASNIRVLLEKADSGNAVIGEKPVAASDIAVLVRANNHAEQMQIALRAQGVRSVRLASSGVFESLEAKELLLLLRAITEPSRTGLVRAALATEVLGYTASDINQLNCSESRWDTLITHMLEYNDLLGSRGVIACLQQVYADMRVPQRLLAQPGGEQKLTNLLQLSELLQVASREHGTVTELLQWMAARIDVRSIDDDLLLRLESDESLVKIVTIHKSKGLEYPIVYLPIPWDGGANKDSIAVFHQPDTLKLCVDPGSDNFETNQLIAQREDFAESLRVAYVALTRARNLCVLCWGPADGLQKSSLAYLLHPRLSAMPVTEKKSALQLDEIITDLGDLAAKTNGGISVRNIEAGDLEVRRYQSLESSSTLQLAEFKGTVRSDWRISSYTGLLRNDNSERPDHDGTEADDDLDASDTSVADLTDHSAAEVVDGVKDDEKFASIFQIPAGSLTGELLHYVFENIDFTEQSRESLTASVTRSLARFGNLGRHDPVKLSELIDACCLLVNNTLGADLLTATVVTDNDSIDAGTTDAETTDIATSGTGTSSTGASSSSTGTSSTGASSAGQSLRLSDISLADRLNELEFYFSVSNASVDDISRVLSAESAYANTATGLSFKALTGLMHGYIDLVVRQNGRYFIVDYKSNLLGPTLDSYGPESLCAAVRSHRYDLQYLIYTVALHRYLRSTLPDYEYAKHFGGVYYLFLRGMRPTLRSGIWFDKPAESIVNALDTLFGLPPQDAGADAGRAGSAHDSSTRARSTVSNDAVGVPNL